jgi:hypothetical protein
MKRRQFVGGLAAAASIAACAKQDEGAAAGASQFSESFDWSIATSWPPKFPGLGIAVDNLADRIDRASGGRLKIKVYAAGELVPAFEAFNAVSRGTVEMGHDAAYYHKGLVPAAQFMTAIPFGMTYMEMNGWLYYGGGLELWRELYEPFNLVPFPCGNTGVQMGGWFTVERSCAVPAERRSHCRAPRSSPRCKPAQSTPPSGSARTTISRSACTRPQNTITTRAGKSPHPHCNATSTGRPGTRCRPTCRQ